MFFYNVYNFDYSVLNKYKRLHKKEYDIVDAVCAFDIETSNIPEIKESFMYVWMFQIEEYTICSRTWDDFRYFIAMLKESIRSKGFLDRLIVYVHNLSFEFSFLKTVFHINSEDVMVVKSRRVLRCIIEDCFEFRCSYLHSNDSLDNFTRKYKAKHRKLVGGLDYAKLRYPWTHLTKQEWKYCIYDVISLVEALKNEMKADGDTLATIPFTSTGYVRRDVREALKPYRKRLIEPLFPDLELYNILRDAFRGGDTHANRFYVGILLNDVHSYDRVSSYPDVQINDKFPISKFKKVNKPDAIKLREYFKKGKAIVFRARFLNVELKNDMWGFPYIPIHKTKISGDFCADNGRILSADLIECAITDIDFKIIKDTYKWDSMQVTEMWIATYGNLPAPLKAVITDYFSLKTQLGGVEGAEIAYIKSKNKINAIYGMTAQDPGKADFIFDYTDDFMKNGGFIRSDKDRCEMLEETRSRMVCPYQWGVWTTANSRYYLYEAQVIAGEHGVYCDTDSVKSTCELDFTDFNKKQMESSKKNKGYATDRNGDMHYTGVMEYEGFSEKFITWGAKKYAVEKNKEIKTTIAGVSKKEGAKELRKSGLESLKPGYVFTIAGGLETKYNDHPSYRKKIGNKEIEMTSNVFLYQSTYKLSITEEYKDLLKKCAEILDRSLNI